MNRTKSRAFLDQSSPNTTLPSDVEGKYSPADLLNFLPWACGQLNIDAVLDITKTYQTDYVSHSERRVKGKVKMLKQINSAFSSSDRDRNAKSFVSARTVDDSRCVFLVTTYISDSLVHMKIDKTNYIPRELLRLFGMIIHFYPQLQGITINSGADMYTVYEICKFLPLSNITEICLDNTYIKEANYDLLLDYRQIKVLSLARCRLEDPVIEKIAAKIEYPKPASHVLSVLNLSSNRITNVGAKHLGHALRTNRQVKYLNLASNMISDEGAEAILNVLHVFALTSEEIIMTRQMYLNYLKDNQELMQQYIASFRNSREFDKKSFKGKNKASPTATSKKGKAENKPNEVTDALLEGIYYERAKDLVRNLKGEFREPFGPDCFSRADGLLYSNGNNSLAWLNLAYNGLSYTSLKLLLNVLKHQKSLGRSPKGLVNVCIEGNPLPATCSEFLEINSCLEVVNIFDRRRSVVSRRLPLGK